MGQAVYDVVIVGAGPIGGYLARTLARASISVLLLEEHKEVGRPFQCAGLVTPEAMAKTGLHESILSSVYGARINSPLGREVKVGVAGVVRTHVVCRKRFDHGIVRMALESGAELWLESKPIDAVVDGGGVRLSIDRCGELIEVTTRLLCGADGAHSWTRRHFRMGKPEEMMVGFQAEITSYRGEEGYLDMFTGEQVAPGLFAWVIPSGLGWRVGVWARPQDLAGRSCEMLYDALKNHPLWVERFAGSSEIARYCGPLPCGIVARPVQERVALFGDAVGLCKPTTGGGIGKGFEQVDRMAAGLIEAIRSDRLSLSDMKKVAHPLNSMKKQQKRARILRDLYLTDSDDEKLESTFETFSQEDVLAMINEHGEIENPVSLGMRLLKNVPQFRRMAVGATWALLTR